MFPGVGLDCVRQLPLARSPARDGSTSLGGYSYVLGHKARDSTGWEIDTADMTITLPPAKLPPLRDILVAGRPSVVLGGQVAAVNRVSVASLRSISSRQAFRPSHAQPIRTVGK